MAFTPDPETSLRLFEEGGTFIFLGVPSGTQVGIDLEYWNTGEKFMGIKMIPPGLHFIHFCTVSRDGSSQSPRLGFFHTFKKGEIVLKRYDPAAEDFVPASGEDEDEISRIKSNLRDLDKSLGPYPYDVWRKWISLSSKITESLCKRLSPLSGRICSAPELSLDQDQSIIEPPPRSSQMEIAESLLPRMSETETSKIKYTQIPDRLYDASSPASQITQLNLDWSLKLEVMIELCGGPSELLAELQFSFVCFLVAQNFNSFEHWKEMIQLVSYSQSAISKYPNLYMDFLSDLYFQVMEVQTDLFTDIVTENNFIYACLKRLFVNIRENESVENRLQSKADRFKKFLNGKFGWEFSEEEDAEDRPVIVSETGDY